MFSASDVVAVVENEGVNMADAYPSTGIPIASRLNSDLPKNSELSEAGDDAQAEMYQVAGFLDQLVEDQGLRVEAVIPAYAWWLGALAAKESRGYQSIDTYVPWIWIFDALALTAPETINNSVAKEIDDETALNGGPRFLLTSTGQVSTEPSFLAKVFLGADSTVGPTFPGWTVRRIARWYCALILSEDYLGVSDISAEEAQDLARTIMRRAVEVDPLGVETGDDEKLDFLSFIEAAAAAAGDETAEAFAGDQRDSVAAGDPMRNAAVAEAVKDAPVEVLSLAARKSRETVQAVERALPGAPRAAGNALMIAGGLAALGFGVYIASSFTGRR